MDRQSSRKKRGCLVRLLFSKFVWVVIFLGLAVFWCARIIDPTLEQHADSLALAAEATAKQQEGGYSGGSIWLDEDIVAIAKSEGADIEVVRELIAAAVTKGVQPHHLLGLAKIESSYCKNIGGGIAIDEIQKRQDGSVWWGQQLTAINAIAKELGVDVRSIPGSIGAGAISCLQLMPGNWQIYGGGDYRRPNDAGLNGSEYLLQHGYKQDPAAAIHSYNPNAGQPYVDNVLAAAAIWAGVSDGISVQPGMNPPVYVMFLENLAYYMEGGTGMPPWVEPPPPGGDGTPPPVIDGLAFPYPGSGICGNWFGRTIRSYVHYGQDYCLPGTVPGPVYAAIDCRVTVSKLVPKYIWEAITWSASGYTVVCEGVTEDGHKIETIYGHLNKDTLPAIGDQLKAGGYLADTQCLGNPAVELCSITGGKPDHHLHFGVKIDGRWFNPNDFLGR